MTSIVPALLAAILLPLALRKRKRTGPQNLERLFQHLSEIGLKASLVESGEAEQRVGVRRSSGGRSEGIIKIDGSNIDYISVISIASQYGVRYFLDYLARSPGLPGEKRKKTRLVRKKSSGVWGRVVDIEWRGDDYLSQQLAYDYRLKDRLLAAALDEPKGSISIFPEPKYEYARIRTSYFLPSFDLFEAIDSIASHISKSGW